MTERASLAAAFSVMLLSPADTEAENSTVVFEKARNMIESIPLYAAAFALSIDVFNLSRPWLSKNPQVPDWPWQILGAIVFTTVLAVVGVSIRPFVHNRSWLMVAFGFILILACFGLMIFTFVGWKKAKVAGENTAKFLTALEPYERRGHIISMAIAFCGILAEIAHH